MRPREPALGWLQARVSALQADLAQATCRLHEGQARRVEARNVLLQAIADNALKFAPSEVQGPVTLVVVLLQPDAS